MTQTMQMTKVRWNLRDVIDRAYAANTRLIVERNGKRVAAIISYEDFQAVEPMLRELHQDAPAASR